MTADEIKKNIPEFLRDIRELDVIYSATAEKLTEVENDVSEQTGDFLLYSTELTESGVDRLAKSLKVDVSALSFEDKVFKLKTYLTDYRPYNRRNVDIMICNLCGDGNYILDFDVSKKAVDVKINLGRKKQYSAVCDFLENVIPANMTISVDLLFNLYGDLTGMTHGELSAMTHEELRSEVLQ